MADHAKLSPSAAERWFTCPGSVVLSDGIPSRSSEFADEGTRAHAMAEAMLMGGPYEDDKEMQKHVLVYVNHVEDLVESDPKAELHAERQVKATDQVWGTADATVWLPSTKTLHVVDLKYGAGVPVSVRGNLQLKIYALAALLTFKYPAQTVVATIAQPRLDHEDGSIRSVEYSAVDLLDFHADLLDAEARVDAAKKGRKSGQPWQDANLFPSEKGCRWCLAAPHCPKLKTQAQELAKQVFAPAAKYDPAALANTLDFLPIFEGWIKNVREFAYAEAEQGRAIPGYKLVEKRATRKWRSEADAMTELPQFMFEDDVFEKKLKTPAQIEKLLKDPEDIKAFEALVSKESSGHTLVHESDKRPAVRIDAAAAFSKA